MNKEKLSLIQNVLDDAVQKKYVAGASCLVFKDELEQGFYASGYADIARNVKFSRDTICRMFSMTKPITSVAVWSLIEEGKLDLLDTASYFFGSFSHTSGTQVTIRDLLNMTSGLSYGGTQDESHIKIQELTTKLTASLQTQNPMTTQEFAKELSKVPLAFEPGTSFEYGLSADVLGAIVEKVTDMKFGEYLQKKIFTPLQMCDTGFYVPQEKIHRLAEEYCINEKGELEIFDKPNIGIHYRAEKKVAFESGGAGLVSTADDYMKFCRMLTNGGTLNGSTILQKQTVDFIRSNHIYANAQNAFDCSFKHLAGYSYGNLMRTLVDPSKSVALGAKGEYGWDGWLGTYMFVDPVNNLTLVYLMQLKDTGTTPTARKIKNVVYSAI